MPPEDHPRVYEIRLGAVLDPHWVSRLDGMTLTRDEGQTVLTGTLRDQAALHGLLRRIADLGLPLLAVRTLND